MTSTPSGLDRFSRLVVPVCDGALHVWWLQSAPGVEYYANGGSAGSGDGANSARVSFIRGDREVSVATVLDIAAVLESYGCSLLQEATRAPADFAWVVSFLLDRRWAIAEGYAHRAQVVAALTDAYGARAEPAIAALRDGRGRTSPWGV